MSAVDAPVTELKGVGPKVAQHLEALGIRRIGDLLYLLPLRYEDRTRLISLAELRHGQRALIQAEVQASQVKFGRRRSLVTQIADAGGAIALRFFHFGRPLQKALAQGTRVRCFGEARAGFRGLEMVHPELTVLDDIEPPLPNTLTPVYPSTAGVQQALLRKLTEQALERYQTDEDETQELLRPEHLPEALRLALSEALLFVHRPPPDADVEALESRSHPAQRRLAFEELLAHQLSVRRVRSLIRANRAPALGKTTPLWTAFRDSLAFQLTPAQQRVIDELHRDLSRDEPMLRLVQGDVGAGKTVVAAGAALCAIASGFQAAVMAPTELLAEQHLRTFTAWFEPLRLTVTWLSGKVTGKARAEALAAIEGGSDLVVGTHALMQEGVNYRNLGLVIIDEQHRFGVHQRLALRDKGRGDGVIPHQLIMTATPIPRTLAMTAYADLDVSVIDELPPGRKPVETVVVSARRTGDVVARVASACRREGRQAYWVCTLVEESEQVRAQAAAARAEALSDALPELKVGLVHGRMKPAEKQAVMAEFQAGAIDLLVATTVIEVGVDVPNASLMVIENAERLGLSQLHQLRGRVGRGTTQSSCVLLYDAALSENARERLGIMRASADGFEIAEKDLELRGPGDMLGTRQTGLLLLRVADLTAHADLLDAVSATAEQVADTALAPKLIARWIGAAERYAGA